LDHAAHFGRRTANPGSRPTLIKVPAQGRGGAGIHSNSRTRVAVYFAGGGGGDSQHLADAGPRVFLSFLILLFFGPHLHL
jgi:hypothetical protein